MKKRSIVLALAMAGAVSGCSASSVKQVADELPAERDSGLVRNEPDAAADGGPVVPSRCQDSDKLDLLLMIDDSQSMKEEQASLATHLPKLVAMFAEGKIARPDGRVRVLRNGKSVHLGVVTSDMGINGAPDLGKCAGFGKDGRLQTPVGCDLGGASYLDYAAGVNDVSLEQPAACILNVGTDGCGFEQQLEAGWKALAPSSNTSFSRGTGGHGDAENKGFLREDSTIAVVYVSDEEDCSIPDASRELFIVQDSGMTVNVSCSRNADKQHVAERYINGLRSLRPGAEQRVVFGAIVGMPPEADALVKNGVADFDAILALPAMKYVEKDDPVVGTLLTEACSSANGLAYPGRRFVEVAKGFGANGAVKSICGDIALALDGIAGTIADRLEPNCE